jgi:hypothetical protein
MMLAVHSRPRLSGALIGALPGGLLAVSGLLIGVLPLDSASGISFAATGFLWIGLTLGLTGLVAGGIFGSLALGDRPAALRAFVAFVLTTAGLSLLFWGGLVVAFSPASDAGLLGSRLFVLSLYFVGPAIVAGGLWVFLTQTLLSPRSERRVPALALSTAATIATVLVVSSVLALPMVGF